MLRNLSFHKKSLMVFGLGWLVLLLAAPMTATEGEKKLSPSDADYRFEPDEKRLSLRGTSAYKMFKEQEGIPNYGGWFVDVYKLELAPWKRMGPGITGAYVDLEGAGALVNAFLLEIPAGGKTVSTHHLFEEQILFLSGEGETHIWQSDPSKKVIVPWKEGTLFSPPLNARHQTLQQGYRTGSSGDGD